MNHLINISHSVTNLDQNMSYGSLVELAVPKGAVWSIFGVSELVIGLDMSGQLRRIVATLRKVLGTGSM
jgi:hypothetical protein